MKKKIENSFRKTGIRDFSVEIEHSFPWVSIKLGQLDCEEMVRVSDWVKENFYVKGNYSHLLPKLCTRFSQMSLVISREQCEKIFGE